MCKIADCQTGSIVFLRKLNGMVSVVCGMIYISLGGAAKLGVR